MAGEGGRTFEHPWWIAGVAVVAGAAAWLLALIRPVPSWELDTSRFINGASDPIAAALHPVMQVGNVAAPILVALVILIIRRDVLLSLAVVAGGPVAWLGAKGIKDLVRRGRPADYLTQIEVRDASARGFGFISGHAAVSMFTAVVVMAVIPVRWRPVAAAIAVVVGVARVVVGVHLPADVVGGWAFGALIGVAVVGVVDRLRPAGGAERSGGQALLSSPGSD